MTIPPWWVLVCWAVFSAYWLASAFFQKETAQKPSPTIINVTAQVCFAIPFMLLVRPEWFRAEIFIVNQTLSVIVASFILCLGGLLLCIWARLILGANWSKNIDFKKGHALVQTGPYRIVRHPIYTGFLVLFLGSALGVGTAGALLGVAVLCIGCLLRIQQEESLLSARFAEYRKYKERTYALIPYIW